MMSLRLVDSVWAWRSLRPRNWSMRGPLGLQPAGLVAELVDQRRALLDQIHGAVGRILGHGHHVVEALGGVGDLRHLLGHRGTRVDLEVDDGGVQLAGQLADLVIQATIARLVELVNELHGLAEIALLEVFDKFAGMRFQGGL